jgi:hypothetical protein
MKTWIKRTARILSIAVFFAVMLSGINPENPFDVQIGLWALLKGVLAGAIFWLAGYILGDIIFKGVVETVAENEIPVHEGGLVQRIREEKEKEDPDANALKPKIGPLMKLKDEKPPAAKTTTEKNIKKAPALAGKEPAAPAKKK